MDTEYLSSAEAAIGNESASRKPSLERRLSRSNSGSTISTSMSASVSNQNSMSQIAPILNNFNETDSLVSDQGLITPRKHPSTSQRRVRDKSYYKGLIYLKGKEIKDEVRKIQKEINLLNTDKSAYLPYKKKAEIKALELQKLQIILANYNDVDDMFNRDIELDEAKEGLQKLQIDNESENKEIEKLFDLTKQQEIVVKELETDLSQDKNVSEILTVTMNPALRDKYSKLKLTDDKLQLTRIKQEKELQGLSQEVKQLENQLNQNKQQKEVLKLLKTLRQTENQREEFFCGKTFSSVAEEGEYLQTYRSDCNDILKGIAQESRALESKIKAIKKELQNVQPKTTTNPFKERSEICEKLKKREKIIDEFFSTNSEQQLALLAEQQKLEEKVVNLLVNVSNKLDYFKPSLNPTETKNISCEQNTLNATELKFQFSKLASDLNEINNLEKKLKDELKSVKNNIEVKEKEIPRLSEVEVVKDKIKNREKELSKEMKVIKSQIHAWKCILKDLKKHHGSLESKLNTDQTYITLSKLEKQWHSLEKENWSLKNSVESMTRYLSVREQVKKIYSELNKML